MAEAKKETCNYTGIYCTLGDALFPSTFGGGGRGVASRAPPASGEAVLSAPGRQRAGMSETNGMVEGVEWEAKNHARDADETTTGRRR